MNREYSKYKERDPKETVDVIVDILRRIGLDTELHCSPSSIEGMHSNYVAIAGTPMRVSGKGTTEAYACASGYAELMERLQNGILVLYPPDGADAYADYGYLAAPDERYTPAAEIIARHDQVLEGWLASLGISTDEERQAVLELLPKLRYDRGDGLVAEVPFADPLGGGVVWIPAALPAYMCGTNGMAAGNSVEEALVQGLSEVFERFVARKVLRGEAVPRRFSRAALADCGVMDLVMHIERGGRYDVRVHDASLGQGYPVVMTTIVDRQRSTFGVRFGAHPSLPVAIERTLTEAFQDRSIQQGTGMNRFASSEEAARLSNVTSMFTSGLGSLPFTALEGKAGWESAPWPSWKGAANAEMLSALLAILVRDGFHPLVRDVSHLGFPSYQILVPGMSDVFAPATGLLEHLVAKWHAKTALQSFPQLTSEEQEHFMGLEPESLMYASPSMYCPPLRDGRMHPCRVFGFLHLARGEYEAARACFMTFSTMTGEMGLRYWRAMAQYATCRGEGLEHEEAMRIVRFLCQPDIAQQVEREVLTATENYGRLFPRMNCPTCAQCEFLACGGCVGLAATNEAYAKIARTMRSTSVTQEPLVRRLQELMASTMADGVRNTPVDGRSN